MKNIRRLLLGTTLVAISAGVSMAEEAWYPLPFDGTTVDGQEGRFEYVPLSAEGVTASENWTICTAVPHMKDPFFVAMNWAMIEEAKLLGVNIVTLEAGGYENLTTQITQVEDCVASGADAVVLVGVSADGMGNLLDQLQEQGIPVIDAVNGINSDVPVARVLTSPYDEGYRAGHYLAELHPAGTEQVDIGWLPGPAGAGFVLAFDAGFQAGIAGSAVNVVEAKYGDVGKEVQARLVEDLLQTHGNLDYVVGTAVMVEGAVPLLRSMGVQDEVRLVSVYTTPGVYESLSAGMIEAAGAAPVALTSRIMLDTAVRVLEGRLEYTLVGTLGDVYTVDTVGDFDPQTVLAPNDFAPIFDFEM